MKDEREDERLELELADAIREDYARAQDLARVPSADVIWLRMALRAREEATRKAISPLVIGQSIGVAAFVGLLVSLVGGLSVSPLSQMPLLLIAIVVGSWLVLAPLAVYLALSRD